ncbi:FKBP-type peptidyl-prolyl cis-trans isomerase [Serinibacter salmoneus]|uniref:Peptidylprolyl isomerase n=1 Tax=Serinibacter salmoneus TaxID=556530 RepID=A0A2A9CZ97_9MICO|nr:peptidylprolyl isomerase [Serinibacter salmoneus]PFG19768.1 peptidylprolyl isomerase [Serinibacter salmoneus]
MKTPGTLVLAVALFLTGCSPEEPEPEPAATVEVAGEWGQRPSITVPENLEVTESLTSTLMTGDGPAVEEGAPLLLHYRAVNAVTSEVAADTYETLPEIRSLTEEDLGEPLFDLLDGATEGSRLMRVELGTAERPDPHVLVVDVLPTTATGVPRDPVAGMPTVTVEEEGPAVSVQDAVEPAEVTTSVLLKGEGTQVASDATVIVGLRAIGWSDGEVLDDTWGQPPREVALTELPPGLSAGLVEQTVGSRVLVVTPPAEGFDETVVYVVDILAASGVVLPSATPSAETTEAEEAG